MKVRKVAAIAFSTPVLPLVLIASVGIALRLYSLGQPSFWNDESDTALQSLGILSSGAPILPSGRVEYQAITTPLLIALAWLLGGQSDLVARIVSVLFGSATIILVFFLGRKAFGTRVGLMSSSMYSLSSWMVAWSRQARFYQEYQFFYLAITLLILTWQRSGLKGSARLAFAGAALLALSALSSYHAVLLFVALAILWAALRWGPGLTNYLRRQNEIQIAVGTTAFALALIVAFWFRIVDLFAKSVLVLVGVTTGEFFTIVPNNQLLYHPTFESFLFAQHPYVVALAIPGAIVLALRNARTAAILTTMFLVPYLIYSTLFASFTITSLYVRYIFPQTPVLFVLASIAVSQASATLSRELSRIRPFRVKSMTPKVLRYGVPWLLLLLMILGPSSGLVPRLSNLSQLPEPQPNYKMATNYVKTLMRPGDVIGAIWPENTYYYLGRTEFWVVSDNLTIQLSGIHDGPFVRFYYTGSILIKDAQEMNQTMHTNPRGWLILSLADLPGVNPNLRSLIITSMQLHKDGSDSTILTFSWNTS